MAELDFRIPLSGRPVRRPDVAGTVGTLAQLAQVRQRGQAQDLLQAQGVREQSRRAEVQQITGRLNQLGGATAPQGPPGFGQGQPPLLPSVPSQTDIGPAGGTRPGQVRIDRPGAPGQAPGTRAAAGQTLAQRGNPEIQRRQNEQMVIRDLQRRGFLEDAEALQTQFIDRDKNLIAQEQGKTADIREKIDFGASLLNGVVDEASYQRVLPQLQQLDRELQALGFPPTPLSDHFDAARIAQLQQRALSFQELLGQEAKQQELSTSLLDAKSRASRARTLKAKEEREAAGGGELPQEVRTLGVRAREILSGRDQLRNSTPAQRKTAVDEANAEAQGLAVATRAAVATGVAEAQAENIRLTPVQQQSASSLNEMRTVADTIHREFPEAEIRKLIGVTNRAGRTIATLQGNPRVARLMALVGRMRTSLLFDREKGGGGALSPNEQAALETTIPTGNEVTAEAFIQKFNIMRTLTTGSLETFLDLALGSNPAELTRAQAVFGRQRARMLETGGPLPGRPAGVDAATRQQLKARGATDAEIDALEAGGR